MNNMTGRQSVIRVIEIYGSRDAFPLYMYICVSAPGGYASGNKFVARGSHNDLIPLRGGYRNSKGGGGGGGGGGSNMKNK